MVARECYIAMLEMDDHLQTMSIEAQRMVAKPVEGWKGYFLITPNLSERLRSAPLPVRQSVKHS